MNNKKSYTISDFYSQYTKDRGDKIDYKMYRAVLTDYYTIILNELLNGAEELKMPFRLGTVKIIKYKPKTYTGKSLSVDFKASKELGYTVYHLNEHSNGYKYRLFWHKECANNKNIYKYTLNLVRAAKRKLAQLIKNNITDYPEI